MRFQILSHASLLVESGGVQLITDPWLKGSCYWRSWWNYPPVSNELINSLEPDYIYITHIHWDHFHGVSLKLFPKTTKIIIPRANMDRMKRDLNYLGFDNVVELNHGQTMKLGSDLEIISYHLYPFGIRLDSALIIKSHKTSLLNLNDCKAMGLPLKQILNSHRNLDFVFASHNSANSRVCYQIIDQESFITDDTDYIENFHLFCGRLGAKYAIPFASNACYLHKDTFKFNSIGKTPIDVRKYWEEMGVTNPELKVMKSGDSWSTDTGFKISEKDWYSDRENILIELQKENQETLNKFYKLEENASISLQEMENYFSKFSKAIPFILRLFFKKHPFIFVLKSGEHESVFKVNVFSGKVEILDSLINDTHLIEIHTSTYIMKHCIQLDLFSHLGISKRVVFKVRRCDVKYMKALEAVFDAYESEAFPIRMLFRPRSLSTCFRRWRELILYFELAFDLLTTGEICIEKFLPPDSTHAISKS